MYFFLWHCGFFFLSRSSPPHLNFFFLIKARQIAQKVSFYAYVQLPFLKILIKMQKLGLFKKTKSSQSLDPRAFSHI